MKKVHVLGAGHAGLIAAQMLRREGFEVRVYEIQPTLPLNHASVLRFRTDALQKALGVPLKKVRVIKDVIDSCGSPLRDALAYSFKVTGEYRTDRSVPTKPEIVERYVHEGNLSEYLSQGLDIEYGVDALAPSFRYGVDTVVSTLPMPVNLSGIKTSAEFKRTKSTCITARLVGVDAYLSAYVTNPDSFIARISLTGQLIQIDLEQGITRVGAISAQQLLVEAYEFLDIDVIEEIEDIRVHYDLNAKLIPIDERERKRIIMRLTDEIGFYSVGRQATWRPNLLLDDVVDDVRKVIMMLNGYSNQLVNEKDYSNV